MTRIHWVLLPVALFCEAAGQEPRREDSFDASVRPFLATFCSRCHSPGKNKGKVDLTLLRGDVEGAPELWSRVLEQLSSRVMPPDDEPQPDRIALEQVTRWIRSRLPPSVVPSIARSLPRGGNLVPHEILFSGKASSAASPPRVWRLRPDAYLEWARALVRGKTVGITQPFTLIPDRGIKDYAGLYSIDEASTEILVRNAEAIVEAQTAHEVKDGKACGKNDSVSAFIPLMDPPGPPTREQLEAAVQAQFRLTIGRVATEPEVARYSAFYERCARGGSSAASAKIMLQAILLRPDAMFRSEWGVGPAGGTGRRMLAPLELAEAVSLALGDRREETIFRAAAKGELGTREEVSAHVRRMLEDPKVEKPRLLGFFREYFEYPRAREVFKDKPADRIKHVPDVLVRDTDRLVLHILSTDRDVFRELLTTPLSFVNYSKKMNKKTGKEETVPADVLPPAPSKRAPDWLGGVERVYGLDAWPDPQPARLPEDTRLGILMQPSWLVAFSTNFENDPVRRGRWIRERLLGGTVPELPIGVAAQVPDEPHRTFRERLRVTRGARCWTCHQKMDDLGLPFENFDHYGRFRATEKVRDPEATARNVDPKGKSLGPVMRDAGLDTTGLIADSGDAALDGAVRDPREMIRKLSASDRVRQVFVRHAFRYFMGRNETRDDSGTLQDADRSYVQSGGSFKALVVALLTSESFLYRAIGARGGPAKGEDQ